MSSPILFVSHGAPSLLLENGVAADQLRLMGQRLDGLDALLVVSPHWRTSQFEIASGARPGTWHDFYGFPPALYDLHYPAHGAPGLAEQLAQHDARYTLNATQPWDHGVWSPLIIMRPQADIPVLQLSMPASLTHPQAFDWGVRLAQWCPPSVGIVASGSLTHNLSDVQFGATRQAPYALRFESWVRQRVAECDESALVNPQHPDYLRAHPHDDHYLPLLIALGAARGRDAPNVYSSPILHGVLSMESYCW